MNNIDRAKEAMCLVSGYWKDDNSYAPSNGIFITPSQVLTAHHCITAVQNISFINAKGEETFMRKNGRHQIGKLGERYDFAIVELEDPIGPEKSIPVLSDENYEMRESLWLTSYFKDRVEKHAVTPDTNHKDFKLLSLFNIHTLVGPGSSGCPIIDENGQVISLLRGGDPDLESSITPEKAQWMEENLGLKLDEPMRFAGLKPKAFAEFIQAEYSPI